MTVCGTDADICAAAWLVTTEPQTNNLYMVVAANPDPNLTSGQWAATYAVAALT
jgi:hypothetical protein